MSLHRTPAPWLAALRSVKRNRVLRPNGSPMNSMVAAALLTLAAAPAAAQSMPLNDTGLAQCVDGTSLVACSAANTDDAATYPRQDGRFGRDAQAAAGQLTKVGGGAAGFDFSCVLWNGTVINGPNCTAGLTANTGGTAGATAATDWACTKDNVTGLVWSMQSTSATWDVARAATYPSAGHNAEARCGYSTGWRLPTRRELLSIVHYGKTSGAAIDLDYFPGTGSVAYWSNDLYLPNSARAWVVAFGGGYAGDFHQVNSFQVRLVRGGQ